MLRFALVSASGAFAAGAAVSDQSSFDKALYYFSHIAKAGGSSYIQDAGAIAGIERCNTQYELNDEACYGLNATMMIDKQAQQYLRGDCEMVSCEGTRSTNLNSLGKHLPADVHPKDVVMFREPMQHVMSMYAMCSQFGLEEMQTKVSFVEWLTAGVDRDETKLFSDHGSPYFCLGYTPRSFQTFEAGMLTGTDQTIWLERTLALVENAAHVAITEHYTLSLCLFRAQLGKEQLAGCSCDAAQAQMADAQERGKDSPYYKLGSMQPQLNVTHDDHGTDTSLVTLTGKDLSSMSKLTTADRQVYSAALVRFRKDVAAAGLSCWLSEPSEKLATKAVLRQGLIRGGHVSEGKVRPFSTGAEAKVLAPPAAIS